MRRPRRLDIREAARRSRRDLRILLLIVALTVTGLFVLQPESGAQTERENVTADDERLEEFDPTEEISADRAIAFPVDI